MSDSAFKNRHPAFEAVEPDYTLMADSFAGERTIKDATTTYLPATAGMIADGAYRTTSGEGWKAYEGYLARAVYPELVKEAAETLAGVLHREPAVIELPPQLEPMRESATADGISLEGLLRRINEQQLLYGRVGLLADVVPGRPVPFLVEYQAPTITNWLDEMPGAPGLPNKLRLVVLDESRPEMDPATLTWGEVERFRGLFLGPAASPLAQGAAFMSEMAEDGAEVYRTVLERDGAIVDARVPSLAGRTLSGIPFVFIGANDLAVAPDSIPLLPIAQRALAIYRGEADYRQALHLQGQDTLVVIGGDGQSLDDDDQPDDKPTRVGAGAKISVPAGGDAKFIGVSAAGLAEQRQCIENDNQKARELGSRILSPPGSQAESGDALELRVSAQTASLYVLAKTGAAGLEKILRQCAEWVGADPSKVKVKPNLNFAEVQADPRSAADLMDAKSKGAPISLKSIHRWLQDQDFTNMTFEDEQREIESEPPLPTPPSSTPPGTGPGATDNATDEDEDETPPE